MEGIRELGKVLEKELNLYRALLELSKAKTQVLLEGDINRLKGITGSEQALMLNLGRLEDERLKVLKNLEEPLGLKAEGATISEILARIDSGNESGLSALQQEITKVLKELDEVNSKNTMLIKKALEHINHTLGLLTSAARTGTVYGIDSEKKGSDGLSSFIDRKV